MIGSRNPRLLMTSALVAAATTLSVAAFNAPLSAAAPDAGQHGHATPPARSARVNPHELPTAPPTGDTPVHIAARNYPVDQATYKQLKAKADADADKRD